jgi:polygalacturonase
MTIMKLRFSLRLFAGAGFFSLTMSLLALPPVLPAINTNNVITITNAPYDAVGDGATDNTLAISNAIVQANKGGKTNNLFGGTVRIPAPGIFLCGPLTFKNNVNMQIDGGAILRMLPLNLFTNYPSNGGDTYGNFFYASGLTNLEISGSGAIDGQGTPWWSAPSAVFNNRPYLIYFNSGCSRVLLQNVTISNAPAQNVVFKGKGGNFMFDGITEFEPPSTGVAVPSHNTDGLDLVGTNMLVQNCNLSVGDDNIALGTSSSGTPSSDTLVTNCAFGSGHGVSIGSNTQGGVSNLTMINCTFNGTDNGIRLKSDNNSSGGSGQGGITQNLFYYNIGMTNVGFPILIYSYYSEVGTPSSITPAYAATQALATVTANTPVWRNITISNLTVTGGNNCVIWSRTELPATNIIFNHVNISAAKSFEIYNAGGVQFIDSQINPPTGSSDFLLFNAQVIVSNSVPTNTLFTFDGLTTNRYGNLLTLYKTQASLQNTNVFDDGPLTFGASTLAISNNFALFPSTILNYALGTNATTINVSGNLNLGGTINITNAGGFTNGAYTLLTYSGNLTGNLPAIGNVPAGFNYAFDTNTAGQVKIIATTTPLIPTDLILQISGGQLQVSWPQDHLGWHLQIQTNNLSQGLGTNWTTLPGSASTNQIFVLIDPANGGVFLRLVSP